MADMSDGDVRRKMQEVLNIAEQDYESLRLGGASAADIKRYSDNVLKPMRRKSMDVRNGDIDAGREWLPRHDEGSGYATDDMGLSLEYRQKEQNVLNQASKVRRGFFEGVKYVRDSEGQEHELPASEYKRLKSRGMISPSDRIIIPEDYAEETSYDTSELLPSGRPRYTPERERELLKDLKDQKVDRSAAKHISDYKLGKPMSKKDEKYVEGFFERFPEVKDWLDETYE